MSETIQFNNIVFDRINGGGRNPPASQPASQPAENRPHKVKRTKTI
jgi:hypothetical protein